MLRLRPLVSAALLAAVLAPAAAGAQNRALGRPAFASSTFHPGVSDPAKAVDGVTQGNYFAPAGIFHSQASNGDWWYVDLGQSYDIAQIDFWNRTDCCSNRIVGSTLGIFSSTPYGSGGPAPLWSAVIPSGAAHQTFAPGGTAGRFVGIQAPSSGVAYLQIAELEVFGRATSPSTVPEPSTWALMAGGLLVLGATARRRGRREA